MVKQIVNDSVYSQPIIRIGQIPAAYDIKHLGGKAGAILKMAERGIKVPSGFIISDLVFEEFWEYNKIPYNASDYLGDNGKIQKLILKGKFPGPTEKRLEKFFNELSLENPDTRYAVRSSALCEDTGNRSMAGFFKSFLDLRTFDDIRDSIKECYASLFSDKVLHYVYDNNMNMDELKMGVIVQKFIKGQPSGVVFTGDTINMDTGFLHINAVDSICADFVEGKLPSSLFIIEKGTKKAFEKCIHAGSPDLSPDMLIKLYDVSMEIELMFGNCQDIEWTSEGGNIYILQARPITTFKTINFPIDWEAPGDENYTWRRLMVEPIPALMQDIIRIEVDSLSKGAYDTLCRLDTYRTCTIQNGYIYVRNKSIENISGKRITFNKMLDELTNQGKCVYHDKILPEIMPLLDSLKRFAGKKLSREEAGEFLALSLEYLKKTWSLHWLAAMVNMHLMKFEKYFLDTFTDMQVQDFYDLIYGSNILTRERELLFSMSATVKNNSTLMEVLNSSMYDEIVYERLKAEPEAQRLMEIIKIYIEEFGLCDIGTDHMLNPVHKLYPVILERPDYVIGQIRKLLDVNESNFFDSIKSSLLNKTTVKNSILWKMDSEGQLDFLNKLTLAEKAFIANSNHNYYIERMYRGYLRLAVMEAGRILSSECLLDKPEDIRYLYINEIISALGGDKSCLGKLQYRKQEHESHQKLLAPDMIGKKADENRLNNSCDKAASDQRGNGTVVLKGVSGLRKKISGKVFVGMPDKLHDERILVLPHTHYGDIMPILSKVEGLIFNWGSPYDHPGIIAREMGIPAIYKTNNATELLKTGDIVELDGYTGRVTVL